MADEPWEVTEMFASPGEVADGLLLMLGIRNHEGPGCCKWCDFLRQAERVFRDAEGNHEKLQEARAGLAAAKKDGDAMALLLKNNVAELERMSAELAAARAIVEAARNMRVANHVGTGWYYDPSGALLAALRASPPVAPAAEEP